MNNTKRKILETALILFNTNGLQQVSMRTIANEMNISLGNLSYHFKKREYIIESLYDELVAKIDDDMTRFQLLEVNLQLLFDISSATMNNLFQYRFFLFDFTQILREDPKLKSNYISLLEKRKNQMGNMFTLLSKKGVIRDEQIPGEYENLYRRIQILGDFWLAFAEIEKAEITQETIHEYLMLIIQSIYPYLTKKGKQEYSNLSWT